MLTARVNAPNKRDYDVIEFISYKLLRSPDGKSGTLEYCVGAETLSRSIENGAELFVMNATGRTIDIFRSKRRA